MDEETISIISNDLKEFGVVVVSDLSIPGYSDMISLGFSSKNVPEIRMRISEKPSVATALFTNIVARWEQMHVHAAGLYSLEGIVPNDSPYTLYRVKLICSDQLEHLTTTHRHFFPHNHRIYDITFVDTDGNSFNAPHRSKSIQLH